MLEKNLLPPSFSEDEISSLLALSAQLPTIAELCASEVFLDCITPDGGIVIDHAWPHSGSLYRESAIGKHVQECHEPAVFAAFRTKLVQRDLKALTQEGLTVWQDVVPICSGSGQCTALLIREKDVSQRIAQEKKYEELAKSYAEEAPTLRDAPTDDALLWQREVHHRVKNNLQTVASILGMQARRCKAPEASEILQENVGRVLSMAAIHDIILQDNISSQQVDSFELLHTLRKNLQVMVPAGKSIALSVQADHVPLPQKMASDLAMVICELVTNAIKHAFIGREQGHIQIIFIRGIEHHSVCVFDDGIGFPEDCPDGFGLSIVRAVCQKLHGQLSIQAANPGTVVTFDCKTE